VLQGTVYLYIRKGINIQFMKRHYPALIGLLLAASVPVKAQSLVLQNGSQNLQGDPNNTLEAHIDVFNSTGSTIDVVAERTNNNLSSNHLSYFCWGITCYGPGTSLAPAEPINGGAANSTFRGYLDPGGSAGVSTVTYCFYDQVNTQDSACIEFTYTFTPTGIDESNAAVSYLSEPAPNPAAGFTLISYRLAKPAADVHVVLNNMLGAKVRDLRMDGTRNTFLLDISDLRPGLYFYSLVADQRIVYTKKLMVADRK